MQKKHQMNYQVEEISGYSYAVQLIPVTDSDKQLLNDKRGSEAIAKHYHEAVKSKFGAQIHIASFSSNPDFPYSATIECTAQSGSV
ncbi:hypothetical protein HH214_09220 [Mucilaginibacter robiniae]|uniref:Uncharacterized protein n=1 Tax=Mucilaginibacter robiniae TaxID=2728022 RepID=A0A7L5E5C4_9SPHI|nr:hypothetical protein [Mucilaginibacter robiniae]QJD96043.1 hypothetical protein HH214_09220 [Mucilaginibacter robiniae]